MVSDMKTPGRAERLVQLIWRQAVGVGVDPCVVLAQSWLETGRWSSWWFAAPRRNPAGIGVNGGSSTTEVIGWQRKNGVWLKGRAYTSREAAFADQVQALAHWAGIRTPAVAALRARLTALDTLPHRPPTTGFGSAKTLAALGFRHNPAGTGWAHPGDTYGAHIAALSNSTTAAPKGQAA